MEEQKTIALDLNRQGMTLLEAGDIDAAKEKFDKAIDSDPMEISSYRNYGELFLRTGEYQEAKNFFKKALLIEKDGEVYFQYGNACFMNDEPHEGLENYNLAMSAGFDSDEMFFFMGLAYEHMNDDQMALRYIQKAMQKNPSRPDYKVKKINVLLRLNMVDEAKETAEDLLANDPELYDGYHIKTTLLLSENRIDEAIEFAKSATAKFPEDIDLMLDYCSALAQGGRLDDALNEISRAKQMRYFEDQKDRFILLEAEINAEKGNLDVAVEQCNECLANEGDDIYGQVRFMLINLGLAKNDYAAALSQSESLIDKDGDDSFYLAALYYRPFCLHMLGREDEAKKYYDEAIRLYRLKTIKEPNSYESYLYRAMCCRDIMDNENALEMLDFMERLDPDIAEVYTIRADVYKQMGKTAEAEQEMSKAYALKPDLKQIVGGEVNS